MLDIKVYMPWCPSLLACLITKKLGMKDAQRYGAILLVDDDAKRARRIKDILESERFSVTVVSSAVHIADLDVGAYRLVLADAQHQPYGGIDMVRDMRADAYTSHVPVILMGPDDRATIVSALEAGADDYVAKPLSMRELIARIFAITRRCPANGQDDDI